MKKKLQTKGQSLVEFVLIVPLFFMILFGIIQIAYMAYVSFAVQRATFAIAREAASSTNPAAYNPYFDLAYSLTPLGQLNQSTWATVLATNCEIKTDGKTVHVQVRYPMPIWVPVIGKIFGQKLDLNNSGITSSISDLTEVFQLLGKPVPDFSINNLSLPYVRLVTFSANALDENSISVD